MITRLLVPLDGSVLAESALPVARRLAQALQGTLILFRVPDVPLSDVSLSVMEAEEEQARAYLTQTALRPELADIRIETMTLCGAVAPSILAAMQTAQADLVVMSSHGRSGITRLALGSVAEQVIRQTTVPVLILHRSPTGEAFHLIPPVALVALDGSERAEAVLGPAADVLAAFAVPEEGTMHLIRIVAPPVEIPASLEPLAPPFERGDRNVQEAENYLLRLTKLLQRDGIGGHHPTVTSSLWVADEIGPTLARAAEQASLEAHEAAFLALASHGRGRWKADSIAMSILEHNTLPLLIVHVPAEHGSVAPGAFPDQAPEETPEQGQG